MAPVYTMRNPNARTTGTFFTRALTAALLLCAFGLWAVLSPVRAWGQTHRAKRPASPKIVQPGSRAVTRAVRSGVKFLLSARSDTGRWSSTFDRRFPGGVDSLVTLTALSLGAKGDSDNLSAAIKGACSEKPTTIYARAIRLTALTRLGSAEYKALIAEDAAFLQSKQSSKGGWGYGSGHPTMQRRPKWTDTCNTTFAVLSLFDAANAGAEVKPEVWSKAAAYLCKVQNSDGGWGYEPAGGSGLRLRGNSFGSMTAAGVTALSALRSKLAADDPSLEKCVESIGQGRAWLAKNYDLSKIPKWGWGEVSYWPYFYLYMLSRVAVESGSAQIGTHAWQGELLGNLISRQKSDGAWRLGDKKGSNDVVHTCFALLALSNAQKPVLVNKLVLSSKSAPDGSDVGALAGWLGRSAKRDARWQFVPASASQGTLDAAPILYVAPSSSAKISDSLAARIRLYALRGGMVLVSEPKGDSGATRKAFLSMFGQFHHHASVLPTTHPAFSLRYKITDPGDLKVTAIGDYCRSRVFIVSNLGKSLRGGSDAGFRLAANLAAYCGIGFGVDAPRRPVSMPKVLPTSRRRRITIARVRHGGDWYAGPLAMRSLHNVLASAMSLGVNATTVDLEDSPGDPGPTLLWLTGTKSPKLTVAQKGVLGAYLKKGGVIFVDSAMGKPEFADEVAKTLCSVLGVAAPTKVGDSSPLITGKFAGGIGSDLTKATVGTKPLSGMLSAVVYRGRVAAVISRAAITVPMDGGYAYGCTATSTANARRLAANVALYAATQHKGR